MEKKTIKKPKGRISRKPEPVDLAAILRKPERPVDAVDKDRHTAKLTPYAEQLLARSNVSQVGNSSLSPCGEWITTRAAAKLTGYSQRHIETLCDEGFFVESRDWKQRPPSPHSRRGGRILVRHSALKKMEGE